MLIERDCVTGPSCISAPPSGPVGSPLREMSAVLGWAGNLVDADV